MVLSNNVGRDRYHVAMHGQHSSTFMLCSDALSTLDLAIEAMERIARENPRARLQVVKVEAEFVRDFSGTVVLTGPITYTPLGES